MLPIPGSPAASWRRYGAKIKAAFATAETSTCVAFWLLGLTNNLLYVVCLTAALDIVGPSVPKGVVLLADVLPSVLVKLIAPYFIHLVPYSVRVLTFVALAAGGMLLVALTPASYDGAAVAWKLLGVAIASLASGGGELSFLGLTHFYGTWSLAAWSSGTGAAGLVGAGAYVLATSTVGLTPRRSLLVFACLPVVMVVAYFWVLPERKGPQGGTVAGYQAVAGSEESAQDAEAVRAESDAVEGGERSGVKGASGAQPGAGGFWAVFGENVRRARGLFVPYMVPLLLVYIAEYTINQGVAPTLLYPVRSTPFRELRDFYPTYNAIYQVGVFISRSTFPFLRVYNLYAPSLLQVLNLTLLTLQSLFNFIPTIWIVFVIVFWEGLLGGLVYVNTYGKISDRVPIEEREFSLSATAVSDSAGICIAAFISMVIETGLCDWQVSHGRKLCLQA